MAVHYHYHHLLQFTLQGKTGLIIIIIIIIIIYRCTLVLYYLKRVNNYDHIINPTKLVHRQTLSTYTGWLPIQTACVIYRKPITCVSLSNDGKFVAFGEVSFCNYEWVWFIIVSVATPLQCKYGIYLCLRPLI